MTDPGSRKYSGSRAAGGSQPGNRRDADSQSGETPDPCFDSAELKAINNEGAALFKRGDLAAAEAKWRYADERGSGPAAANLGMILAHHGHYEAAEAAYRRAAERGEPAGAYRLAEMMVELGDLPAAEPSYRQADELGHPKGARKYGQILYNRGEMGNALAAWRRADERGDALAAFNLGCSFYEMRAWDSAEMSFRRASDRGDRAAALNLGAVLQIRGDYTGAMEAYQLAINLDARDPLHDDPEIITQASRELRRLQERAKARWPSQPRGLRRLRRKDGPADTPVRRHRR